MMQLEARGARTQVILHEAREWKICTHLILFNFCRMWRKMHVSDYYPY